MHLRSAHCGAEKLPAPRQPRHHGADRYASDAGDIAIAHLFKLSQHQYLPILDGKLFERAVDELRIVAAYRQRFGIAADIVNPSRQPLVAVEDFIKGRAVGCVAPPAPASMSAPSAPSLFWGPSALGSPF